MFELPVEIPEYIPEMTQDEFSLHVTELINRRESIGNPETSVALRLFEHDRVNLLKIPKVNEYKTAVFIKTFTKKLVGLPYVSWLCFLTKTQHGDSVILLPTDEELSDEDEDAKDFHPGVCKSWKQAAANHPDSERAILFNSLVPEKEWMHATYYETSSGRELIIDEHTQQADAHILDFLSKAAQEFSITNISDISGDPEMAEKIKKLPYLKKYASKTIAALEKIITPHQLKMYTRLANKYYNFAILPAPYSAEGKFMKQLEDLVNT